MEPGEVSYRFGGEFHAFRVDFEPPGIDFTLPCDYIQVTARGPGEKDGSVFVFDFFETAEAALFAERFPCLFVRHVDFHTLGLPDGKNALSGLWIFPGYLSQGYFKGPVVKGKSDPVRKDFFDPGPFDNSPFSDGSAVNDCQTIGIVFLPADPRHFQCGNTGGVGSWSKFFRLTGFWFPLPGDGIGRVCLFYNMGCWRKGKGPDARHRGG